jgi:hypothetical protein
VRLDHLLSKEHSAAAARQGVVVYSSFLKRLSWGGGASDCGTLTIRRAAAAWKLVLLKPLFGVEVWNVDVWMWIVEARCWVLRNRAGLVGSGCSGFSGSLAAPTSRSLWIVVGVVVWLGPAFTKPS